MRYVLLTSMLALLVLSPLPALADGFFIPKLDPNSYAQDITEPDQKAVIVHHDGKERLILQVGFKGSVSQFAWLIPTPSQPKLSPTDGRVFEALHEATASRVRYWFDADTVLSWGAGATASVGGPSGKPSVEVLERRAVAGYDVSVLRATSADDLLLWLRTNGYQVTDRIGPVLQEYIGKGWVFTAARIDTANRISTAGRSIEGLLNPLQLEFAAEQPVYPLKISSLNSGRTNVLLYVIADHFVNGTPLRTVCAMDDQPSDWSYPVEELRRRNNTLTWDKPGSNVEPGRYCVTKLSADLEPGQMTDDLVLAYTNPQIPIPPGFVSPPFLENLGATALIPIAFLREVLFLRPSSITETPWGLCVLLAFCLVLAIVKGRRRWWLWLIASLALLVVPLFLMGAMVSLGDDIFQPAGLITVIAVPLAIALLVRRAAIRRRKKAVSLPNNLL